MTNWLLFTFTDLKYSWLCIFKWNIFEFEAGASWLKCWNDFAHIVTDETKSCILCIFFDYYNNSDKLLVNWKKKDTSSQSKLSRRCHKICLIKDNQFYFSRALCNQLWEKIVGIIPIQGLSTCKIFNSLSNYFNSSFIRGIQLIYSRLMRGKYNKNKPLAPLTYKIFHTSVWRMPQWLMFYLNKFD